MNDDLLTLWAQARELPEPRAEAICRAVLSDVAPGLDAAWWRGLFAPMRGALGSGRRAISERPAFSA